MIVQTKTVSFTTELLEAIHNFSAGGDTFKIALYTALATLNATTTGYTSANDLVEQVVRFLLKLRNSFNHR